ncbi:MAG: hypothetical protein EOP56_01000 [Sphingobacteriales bacterium]|nr:MAG: hypothetical protein EOP56_01000 [Sphingobacteriales bacterium]
MKVAAIFLFLVFSSSISYGQEQGNLVQYANDKTVADERGNPMHPSIWYFPSTMFQDTMLWLVYPKFMKPKDHWTGEQKDFFSYGMHGINPGCIPDKETFSREMDIPLDSLKEVYNIKTDTLELEWFSEELRFAKEPILYNAYLGRDIYRFTWLRSFDRPIVITIEKDGNKLVLKSKTVASEHIKDNNAEPTFGNGATIINDSILITPKLFNDFKRLLNRTALLSSPYKLRSGCIITFDGAMWIFEAHTKDGYYCTSRHAPKENEPINAVGKFLIKLSKSLKDVEIY